MMLGKTAGGLFWMFRYLERAENTARLLEAGWRMALTRSSDDMNEWVSILTTAGMHAAYEDKFDEYTPAQAINFMLRDKDNASCIMTSVDQARSNARLVRTALTIEVWEAVNECWMDLKKALARPVNERDLYDTLNLIRNRTAVVRGALHGTMLRNDAYAFSRLGTFLERADNTARILDVKYYVLLPTPAHIGTSIDNAQWEVILRSVSSERSYRWVNGGEASARGIVSFLMLDQRLPRSLAFCAQQVRSYLGFLEAEYCTHQESNDQADLICNRIESTDIDDVFKIGLHEMLGVFISDTTQLSALIEKDFRFYE